jgi:hypothetical protein
MTQQQYKIVSVRLTKEEAEAIAAIVSTIKEAEPKFKTSDFLRLIIREWLRNNK